MEPKEVNINLAEKAKQGDRIKACMTAYSEAPGLG